MSQTDEEETSEVSYDLILLVVNWYSFAICDLKRFL